eukprot:204447-Prymnesium_polylepis.2
MLGALGHRPWAQRTYTRARARARARACACAPSAGRRTPSAERDRRPAAARPQGFEGYAPEALYAHGLSIRASVTVAAYDGYNGVAPRVLPDLYFASFTLLNSA